MESVDDFESFSLTGSPSSAVPERKLKRLKKAKDLLENSPKFETLHTGKSNIEDFVGPILETLDIPASNIQDLEESNLETLDLEKSNSQGLEESNLETLDLRKSNSQDLEEPDSGSRCGLERFGDEYGLYSSDVGGLGIEDVSGAKRTLDFDSVYKELDQGGDDGCDDVEVEKENENEDLRVEESGKKRRVYDVSEENKDKEKRVKSASGDGKRKLPVLPKRRTDKERREQLEELRAGSQRLLRETRDLSFKSAPFVQMPISSVLEKIRQRKKEILKKSVKLSKNSFVDDYDYGDDNGDDDGDNDDYDEFMINTDLKNAPTKEKVDDKATKMASKDAVTCPANVESSLDAFFVDECTNTAKASSHEVLQTQMAVDEEPKQAFRAPIDDTPEPFSGSQTNASQDELPDETPNSPLEEVLAPSLLAMNLKLGSEPPDDVPSDEEDNDKENIDPSSQKSPDLPSSPIGDPVKAFVDDEAEEEDDSDNDLLRFQDNEEDEDIEDIEELNDMIATGYEEKPVDTEKRNDLHQKWLWQQDAAGTEKLLRRFKCGSNQTDKSFQDGGEDEESDQDNEEFDDEDTEDLAPTNVVRMNLRRVKEMIPQMFTDKDDAYKSSDDEETENTLVKQFLFEKSEAQTKFLSPAEDKNSKEVFSLIKKLNIVPDSRKKPKPSALSDMRLLGGNRTVSSKSSFLFRGSNHSQPSYQKYGSSMIRPFIFERDDSHGRDAVPGSEGSKTIQRENQPTKSVTTRIYNSQIRSSTQNTKVAAETHSGTALFEILKRSSLQSSSCTQDRMVSHTESLLATFKLEKP